MTCINQIVRASIVAGVAAFGTLAASAAPMITNGTFTSFSGGSANGGQIGTGANYVTVTGWSLAAAPSNTTTGIYTFLFTPAGATAGVPNAEYPSPAPGLLGVYPQAGGTLSPTQTPLNVAPGTGNIIGFDPYQAGVLYTTVSGLTVGQNEVVTFDVASSSQQGFNAATTTTFLVGLGTTLSASESADQAGPTVSAAVGQTSAFQQESVSFIATSTSEVLSFMENSTPQAAPPFGLLADVTVTETSPTPEPGTLALLGTGILSIGGVLRSRLRK